LNVERGKQERGEMRLEPLEDLNTLQRSMFGVRSSAFDILAERSPIILVEGRRSLPAGVPEQLEQAGNWMATRFPGAIFRSGNADGSDTEFARGVTSVDPARMQYVLPSPNMGKARRHPDSPSCSLAELPQEELDRLCDLSVEASPSVDRLAAAACGRIKSGPLAGKGRYLLRDTLKVTGSPTLHLAPATLGLFYVNLDDPEAGGTGHTIRVCRQHNIPVAFQDDFLRWREERR